MSIITNLNKVTPKTMELNSNIAEGNKAFRENRFNDALELYTSAIQKNPGLQKVLQFNIELLKKKLNIGSNTNIDRHETAVVNNNVAKKTKPVRNAMDSSREDAELRTIVVAMVRNESAILGEWLSHIFSLFDEVHIVDHSSTDGTRKMLSELAPIFKSLNLYYYDQHQYRQRQIMTHIVKNELVADKNDWVFFLDADEFIPFKCKQDFVNQLAQYASASVIRMPWLNLIPEEYGYKQYFGNKYLKPTSPSAMSKVAFKPAKYREFEYHLEQGNHHLVVEGRRESAVPAFSLLHIPIRSHSQISAKVSDGISAYRAMDEDGTTIGFHWFEMEKYLKHNNRDEDLNGLIRTYSEATEQIIPVTAAELCKAGYIPCALSVSTLSKEAVIERIIESACISVERRHEKYSHVKTLVVDSQGRVGTTGYHSKQHADFIAQEAEVEQLIASSIRINDKEYRLPKHIYTADAMERALQLCKSEITRFLGSRTLAPGTCIIDYLDGPPLHTVFVADLLRTCRLVRLCGSEEEVEFVKSLCAANSISNVTALGPDAIRTNFSDRISRLVSQLVYENTNGSSVGDFSNDMLIMGSCRNETIDSVVKNVFSDIQSRFSLFYAESTDLKDTWQVSKPGNIFCFGLPGDFCRSEFSTGAYATRKPGLDIVVAMYNTPKYIIDCVDSLITTGRDDVNVIVVNDGSTDDSLEIVNKRYSGHPRVRIVTKKNGGCASARNYGRLQSTSTHIAFVDSDDFTDPDMFTKLYDLALYTGAEVTQSGFDFYHEDAQQKYSPSYEDALFSGYPRQDFHGNRVIRVAASDLICGQPTIWRRVYRRDFLDAKRVFFPENIRAYDDYIFHTLSIFYARDIYMMPDIRLHYRQHAAQDIKQGDERHFYEIYMFKQLLRRSLEEGWPDFALFLPSILNSIRWSLQTLRSDLVKPFAHSAAKFIWCVENVYGASITSGVDLASIEQENFLQELSRLRSANSQFHVSYVWAYIESIDNHPLTLSMLNVVK